MKFVLDIPFELRGWATTQQVKWSKDHRVSMYTGSSLPESLRPFSAQVFSWEWVQEQAINQTWLPPKVTPQWAPRDHQSQASKLITAAWKAKSPGFLLADDVGLGKTISAWSFVLGQSWAKRVLVVSPVSVLAHWRNTIIKMGHDDKHILLMNYERLGKLFESPDVELSSQRKKGKQKRLAREGQAPEFDIIIFDESHRCKNITAARSQLAKKLANKSNFVIWSSATAGQTPLELAYLTPLLAYSTRSKVSTMSDFELWCQKEGLGVRRGDFGKWIWDGAPDDIEKIKAWLFDGVTPIGIRRLPTQIAGWKELERQIIPVDLDPQEAQAYQKEWEQFRQEEILESRHTGTTKQSANALVRRLRFRQKSSWLRTSSTFKMIQDYLENGVQVAVSVAFHETLGEIERLAMADKIPCVVIHGKMSTIEKEAARLSFQNEEVPLVIFTVEEGISLHQGEYGMTPRVLLVHDLRWSAIQMAQIEGRCHRDGFFAPSVWLIATRTVETQIAQVLTQRIMTMKSMMGDDVETLKAIEQLVLKYVEDSNSIC